jgi:porphobilinogen synthase
MNHTPYQIPEAHRLHPRYATDALRAREAEGEVSIERLVYPLFVTDGTGVREAIGAMPGQYRWTPDRLEEALAPMVEAGLPAVLIFGVPSEGKDAKASMADAPSNPAVLAVRKLRELFPNLRVMTDVCLCAYTDHGHCGILNADGSLDNDASVTRLAESATAYAEAGAHVVAPSDMMDGRVGAIRHALDARGLTPVEVMSYAAKFASCFYGPFRDAAKSAPSFGDRRAYQLPPAARKLALDAVDRDIAEGAASVMVKPAGPYLDIIRETRDRVSVPVACYQVSGEYAMLYHAARAGSFELKPAVLEALTGFRRAGAEILITYFAPEVLEWLKK